jgi:hypothetical protein
MKIYTLGTSINTWVNPFEWNFVDIPADRHIALAHTTVSWTAGDMKAVSRRFFSVDAGIRKSQYAISFRNKKDVHFRGTTIHVIRLSLLLVATNPFSVTETRSNYVSGRTLTRNFNSVPATAEQLAVWGIEVIPI